MKTSTARLALAAVVVLGILATRPVAAPVPTPKPAAAKDYPADLPASPAIDPAKLANSATLRIADARHRADSTRKLKKLALAVHLHADDNAKNALPGDVMDQAGKPLLSWRVLLLPHVGEKVLFKQFKQDEPWDSKHNLALLEKMPKVFASPRVSLQKKGYTVYQVFSGPGALYQKGKPRYRIGQIPDGTSNTILIVEASKAVPWTKPADIPYDVNKKLPPFGKAYHEKPLCALADGSTRVLDLKQISPATLKYAISPDDGMPLGADW